MWMPLMQGHLQVLVQPARGAEELRNTSQMAGPLAVVPAAGRGVDLREALKEYPRARATW